MQYREDTFESESTQDWFVDIVDFLADMESDYDDALELESSGCTDATTLFSRSEEQNNDDGLLLGEIINNEESSTPVFDSYTLDPLIPLETSIAKPRMPPARAKSTPPDTLRRQIDDARQQEQPRRKSANIPMPNTRSTFISTENDVDRKVCFDLELFQSWEQMKVPKAPEPIDFPSRECSISSNHFLGASPSFPDNLGEPEDLNELKNLNNETVASSTIAQSDDWCSMSKSSVEPGRKRCRRKEPVEKEYVTTITDKDVLLGRGGYSHHHPGNRSYRKVILENQKKYKKLDNNEKTALSMKLVAQVKETGGRFLKRDQNVMGEMYYIVPDMTARLKVSQALREDHTPDGRRLKKERTSSYQR